VKEAAPTIGLQIQIINASTIGEIDAAFSAFARERPDVSRISQQRCDRQHNLAFLLGT
jgi:hypothetical protein